MDPSRGAVLLHGSLPACIYLQQAHSLPMLPAIWSSRFIQRLHELSPISQVRHLEQWVGNLARVEALCRDCSDPEKAAEDAIRINRAFVTARAELSPAFK